MKISLQSSKQMELSFLSPLHASYGVATATAGTIGVVVSRFALHRGDQVQSPGSAYRQFRFVPKMEFHTCYYSQKVTGASV